MASGLARPACATGIVILFHASGILSAALMFVLEPMAGKALLPLFGGSSGIWTAVMLLFQLTLLLGYGLRHVDIRRLGARRAAGGDGASGADPARAAAAAAP